MTFEFKCTDCGEIHRGIPTFGTDSPLRYRLIPEAEREARCSLGTDECVIDEKEFYIRGCLEIPVIGESDPFVWGAWVSLSFESFLQWLKYFGKEKRSHIGPFFGWLNTRLPTYPDTANLKANVRLRDDLLRPLIELEPTDHPLAVEQRNGITAERVAEIYAEAMHGRD
jgi:hypothetical protein